MIAIPSPFNVVNHYFPPDRRAALEPRWEAGLLQDIEEIAAALPHDRIAIQWDCAHDMQAYDGARECWFEPANPGIVERLVRIGNAVPADIEMGYHLCYGSFGGKHFVEPKDMGAMVRPGQPRSPPACRAICTGCICRCRLRGTTTLISRRWTAWRPGPRRGSISA